MPREAAWHRPLSGLRGHPGCEMPSVALSLSLSLCSNSTGDDGRSWGRHPGLFQTLTRCENFQRRHSPLQLFQSDRYEQRCAIIAGGFLILTQLVMCQPQTTCWDKGLLPGNINPAGISLMKSHNQFNKRVEIGVWQHPI